MSKTPANCPRDLFGMSILLKLGDHIDTNPTEIPLENECNMSAGNNIAKDIEHAYCDPVQSKFSTRTLVASTNKIRRQRGEQKD